MPITNSRKNRILAATALLLAMTGVAAAAAYITKENLQPAETHPPLSAKTVQPATQAASTAQPQQKGCDDGNVLGYVAGGAAGGILGHQVGKGSGNTAATIGGVLGGAYLGGKAIPLHNVTCRQ